MAASLSFIRPATAADASALTSIAHESKRHWGYPDEWMERWKADLTITPAYVAAHEVFLHEADGEVEGFYAHGVQRILPYLEFPVA